MIEQTLFPSTKDIQISRIPLISNGYRPTPAAAAVEDESATGLTELLDEVRQALLKGSQRSMSRTLDDLAEIVNDLRQASTPEEWQELIDAGRDHPLFLLTLEDPITRRAFDKPRGYPGDAVLIDFIYGAGNYAQELDRATPTGRNLYRHNRMVQASLAVRNRRDILAKEIGETLAHKENTRILSFGAGHLREAEQITWSAVEGMDLFLALDQDTESIGEIARQNYHPSLVAEEVDVRQVLSGKMDEGDFDLIYVAGLYDYLTNPVAVRLTEILFSKLRPGGKLLVANFMPSLVNTGFMEMFMDWHLVYRDEEQVAALAETLSADDLLSSKTYQDGTGQVCFLEMVRS